MNPPHYKQLIPATEPYQLHLSSRQGPHQLPEPGDVRRQAVVARNGETLASLLSLWTPDWRERIASIISIFSLVPLRDKSPTAERSYCGVTYNPCTKLFPHLRVYNCTYSSAPLATLNMVHRCVAVHHPPHTWDIYPFVPPMCKINFKHSCNARRGKGEKKVTSMQS